MPTDSSTNPNRKFHLDRHADRIAERIARSGDADHMISTITLAEITETSKEFWEGLRCHGLGPEFVKLSPRKVRYRVDALVEWLNQRSHIRSSEYAASYKPHGRKKGSRLVDGHVVPPTDAGAPAAPPVRLKITRPQR